MTGWLEYAIFIGATTAVTIIVKNLQCKYNENALTVEMIVEVTRRASQAHIRKFYHVNKTRKKLLKNIEYI